MEKKGVLREISPHCADAIPFPLQLVYGFAPHALQDVIFRKLLIPTTHVARRYSRKFQGKSECRFQREIMQSPICF